MHAETNPTETETPKPAPTPPASTRVPMPETPAPACEPWGAPGTWGTHDGKWDEPAPAPEAP
jgi:hypothetical protein